MKLEGLSKSAQAISSYATKLSKKHIQRLLRQGRPESTTSPSPLM